MSDKYQNMLQLIELVRPLEAQRQHALNIYFSLFDSLLDFKFVSEDVFDALANQYWFTIIDPLEQQNDVYAKVFELIASTKNQIDSELQSAMRIGWPSNLISDLDRLMNRLNDIESITPRCILSAYGLKDPRFIRQGKHQREEIQRTVYREIQENIDCLPLYLKVIDDLLNEYSRNLVDYLIQKSIED